jgi:hypothetical protein
MAVVPWGDGEVLILADLGLLGNAGGPPANLAFWRNLARYAKTFKMDHGRPVSPP